MNENIIVLIIWRSLYTVQTINSIFAVGRAPYSIIKEGQVYMADGIKSGKIPGLLKNNPNQEIYLKVLNFEPDRRASAIEWLKDLESFVLWLTTILNK